MCRGERQKCSINGTIRTYVFRQEKSYSLVGVDKTRTSVCDQRGGKERIELPTMTAPFLAMTILMLALLLLTTSSFYISSYSETRHARHHSSLEMARIKQAPSIEQRTRRRYNKWPRMIRRLEEYHTVHGHSRVSSSIDPVLHKWTLKLRNNYRHQIEDANSTRGPRLSADKRAALERLEFPWNAQEDAWRVRYKELCQFHSKHGHCRVPSDERHRQLAVWASNQRQQYRYLLQGQNTTLSQERLDMLEQISFLDDFQTYQEVWNLRLEELKEFYTLHNHTNVPEDYIDNYSLGQWVMNQRTQYKRFLAGLPTCLTPARIAALEVLDFRWNLLSYNWFTMLQRLKQHSSAHDGNLDNLDYDLRIWVIKQRHLYRQRMQNRTSPLTDKRIKALEQIAGFAGRERAASNHGPSVDDWAKLFAGIREKGITPDMPPKKHWFEGQTRDFQEEMKEIWTEEDLLDLWNQED